MIRGWGVFTIRGKGLILNLVTSAAELTFKEKTASQTLI